MIMLVGCLEDSPCNLRGLFGCLAIIGALGLKGFGACLILPRRCGSINITVLLTSGMLWSDIGKYIQCCSIEWFKI